MLGIVPVLIIVIAQPRLPGCLRRTDFRSLISCIPRSDAGLLNHFVDGLPRSRNGVPVGNAAVHEGHRIEATAESISRVMGIRRAEPPVEFVHEVARLGLAPDLHDVMHLVGRRWLEFHVVPGLLFSAIKPLHGANPRSNPPRRSPSSSPRSLPR